MQQLPDPSHCMKIEQDFLDDLARQLTATRRSTPREGWQREVTSLQVPMHLQRAPTVPRRVAHEALHLGNMIPGSPKSPCTTEIRRRQQAVWPIPGALAAERHMARGRAAQSSIGSPAQCEGSTRS